MMAPSLVTGFSLQEMKFQERFGELYKLQRHGVGAAEGSRVLNGLGIEDSPRDQ